MLKPGFIAHRLLMVVLSLVVIGSCGPGSRNDYVSPAANRTENCEPGGYPLGSAVFNDDAGFEFDRIDWLIGDFPDGVWSFGGIDVETECETLAVGWPIDDASSAWPSQLELLRTLTPRRAERAVMQVLNIDGLDNVTPFTDAIWTTNDRWATGFENCVAGRLESTDLDRDLQRFASLLELIAERACPESLVSDGERPAQTDSNKP